MLFGGRRREGQLLGEAYALGGHWLVLRSTGAIPVRRDRHHDVVNQVQQFEQSSRLWLAIAPAGTRSDDHRRADFITSWRLSRWSPFV